MAAGRFRVTLYSPDRAISYDGRTREAQGIGGGITARLSLCEALVRGGHDVTAVVNCASPLVHAGVRYQPLDATNRIDSDVLIAISTGGALSFAPLRAIDVKAPTRIAWVQGVPKPHDLDAIDAGYVYAASNFLRDVCVTRWRVPPRQLFVCYNGIHQEYFRDAEAGTPPERDQFAIAYVGPPEKGLAASIEVLRRLRKEDDRFHLDVFGGSALWGRAPDAPSNEPGLRFKGLVGQRHLAHQLFAYEYCLALQTMAEGFGMAVQEAKRAGAIVVASRVGALAELIRHGMDGYVLDGAHDSAPVQQAAADLILRLADDPPRRRRIRQRALDTPWSWDLAAEAMAGHWRAIANGRDVADVLDLADGRHRTADGAYFPSLYPISPLADRLGVPDPPRVLIGNTYFGHGNLGDEAILDVLLEELTQKRPATEVIAVTGDPKATTAAHDIAGVHEHDIPALREAASKSQLIVLGGGGLLHDHYGVDETKLMRRGHWGLVQAAAFPLLAHLADTPFALAAVGAGPLTTTAGRRLAALITERADAGTVRDEASRVLLEEAGADVSRISVAADPVVLLTPASAERTRSRLRSMGVADDARLLGIALRAWSSEHANPGQWEAAVAAAIDRIAAESGLTPLFVPFQPESADAHEEGDTAVAERVRGMMRHGPRAVVANVPLTPSLVQGIFSMCDLVLSMRLHGVILAATAGAPVVAIRYDDKVGYAADQLGLREYVVDLGGISAERLAERLLAAAANRPQIRAAYDARLSGLRVSAGRTVQMIADLLTAPHRARAESTPEWTAMIERARAALADERPAATPADRAAGAARRAARALLPSPWRRTLRLAWHGRLMSREEFAFERYTRERYARYGADLRGVRGPGEPGLVSVVLPVYNGEALIRESIDSVLSQTRAALELIIVNDGSTDGTGAIADDYARRDPRVRVIHQDNRKIPAALARGFGEARGEFLTWTSADNRLKPRCLEQLVDCLVRHPDWDMVYGNLDMIDGDGRPLQHSAEYGSYQQPHGSEHVHLPETAGELNVRANNFVGAAFLYRDRVRALIGEYSPHRFGVEDYDYWMRVNELATLRHADVDDPMVDYRFHRDSLTARAAEIELPAARQRLLVFDEFRRDAGLWPILFVFNDPASDLQSTVRERARSTGHLVYDGSYDLPSVPAPWVPVVYVADVSAPACREDLPSAALKVLIADPHAPRHDVPGTWDLRLVIGHDSEPRPLQTGWIGAANIDSVIRAIDIRARAWVTARIEALAESPPAAAITASVVIPAGRPISTLVPAVEAALQQDFPAADFEVIVVDNNPRDPQLAALLERLPSGVRRVVCPIRGLSAARNAGLGAARGRYVCYLDDDSIPEPRWLRRLCEAFEAHPRTAVIGGPIVLSSDAQARSVADRGWLHYWSHYAPAAAGYTEVSHWADFPWGANWAGRRSALYAIGGFRLAFGRSDDDHRGGEELVAAALVRRLGYTVAIEPGAVVRHHVDPSRFTNAHVRETMLARHLAAYAAARDGLSGKPFGLWSGIARLLFHHIDPRIRRWPHVARDVAYRKRAQWRLLSLQWSDLRQRWRSQRKPDQ